MFSSFQYKVLWVLNNLHTQEVLCFRQSSRITWSYKRNMLIAHYSFLSFPYIEWRPPCFPPNVNTSLLFRREASRYIYLSFLHLFFLYFAYSVFISLVCAYICCDRYRYILYYVYFVIDIFRYQFFIWKYSCFFFVKTLVKKKRCSREIKTAFTRSAPLMVYCCCRNLSREKFTFMSN